MSRKLSVLALVGVAASAAADVTPHGGMIRYPDVSASQIVFVYANDIWLVPREGGVALPLASPPGQESFPRFSPDGKSIGFIGNYDGDRDLYTVPITGGPAFRVTHEPSNEILSDWTPDGKLLFWQSGLAGLARQTQLFTVSPEGGMPTKLPPAYGAVGAISGNRLAFTPHSRDMRTWKRYMGGMATDIWVMNLDDLSSERVTDWGGTDTQPMWNGDDLYYLSDAGPEHRLNIWKRDAGGKRTQVTDYADYDVKWPAIGPGPDGAGEIVFQHGSGVYLLSLASGEATRVEITIPGDRPKIRPRTVDAGDNLTSWDISSTGNRAVLEARGDIWTVPAKHGTPRNLTRTDGASDRYPAWSPDGRWVCYVSDADGEYEYYVTQSDGKGEPRQLTDGDKTFFFGAVWSPDSDEIAYMDKAGNMYLTDVEDAETVVFDRDEWANTKPLSFSHDGTWIAYSKTAVNSLDAIWLYNTETGDKHRVTGDMFDNTNPVFDREGKYLYYTSTQDFEGPVYQDVGTPFVYVNSQRLMVVPLRDDIASPFAPKIDEEKWDKKDKDEKKADDENADDDNGDAAGDDDANGSDEADDDSGDDGNDQGEGTDDDGGDQADDADEAGDEDAAAADDDDGDKAGDKEEEKPLEIDLIGFEARAIRLPVDRGRFRNLSVNDKNKLIYVRADEGADKPAIKIFDVSAEEKDRKEETVMDDARAYTISADGKKLMIAKNGSYAIADAKKGAKMDDKVQTKGLDVTIDPRDEWEEVFTDAWRRHRDFFYVENMHGVDWDAVREQYDAMLADATSREDVSFIIGEMISELNIGHAYYFGGDVEDQPSRNVGMLGCDFELADGAYRISRILTGGDWDADARGPLSQPGVDVKEGDYLLAVNGIKVDTTKDPWAAFIGLAGKTITLTVSDKPEIDDDAREAIVETIGGEGDLRYRAWIEDNRRHVDEATDGRVGYIHVPDTGINGQNELFRQFFGQMEREALIIDERWNGGGQLPNRFIELLNRPRTNYFARRDGRDWPTPFDSHQGAKCMLINGLAGSGGDMFPWLFRHHKLGPLIGMRTWGGLVGITGMPGLIDGGYTSVPSFGFYETDGTWGVEGYGVAPDIEVIDHPTALAKGEDPQLDKAIEVMEKAVRDNPYIVPPTPEPPVRAGMGIEDEDR